MVAQSNADDAAIRALADASRVIAPHEQARVVGGQMVALLAAAFPVEGIDLRRTVDADAALSMSVAQSGQVHAALEAEGYAATTGNHYELSGRMIDLLVPAPAGTFTQVVHGGRGFDAAPGIMLAVSGRALQFAVEAQLLDGGRLAFLARTPSLEVAVVLKALATASRIARKDITDLYTLLSIVHEYSPEEVGEWRLDDAVLVGSRLDAAVQLYRIVDGAGAASRITDAGIATPRFVALVNRYVTRPAPPLT